MDRGTTGGIEPDVSPRGRAVNVTIEVRLLMTESQKRKMRRERKGRKDNSVGTPHRFVGRGEGRKQKSKKNAEKEAPPPPPVEHFHSCHNTTNLRGTTQQQLNGNLATLESHLESKKLEPKGSNQPT